MIALWVLLGVAALALASAIWPGWIRIFQPTPSRIPGAPSRTLRTWPVRAVALAIVGGIAAYGVRTLWPDDDLRDIVGNGAVLALGIALSIWVLASIVARYDRETQARAAEADATDGGVQPAGYLVEALALGATLLTVLISGIGFASTVNPDPAPADAVPSETSDPADEVLRLFNTLHYPLEVLDAPPATGSVVDAWRYAPVDAASEMPYVVWHQSGGPAGTSPGLALDDADLVLQKVSFSCTAVALVVIESETTVSIGIAVAETTPVATPGPTETTGPDALPTPVPTPTPVGGPKLSDPPNCLGGGAPHTDWFPVQLAQPLGDRDVLTLSGGGIQLYSPPVDYDG